MDKKILTIVKQHLIIKDKEKKLFGEVFTPVELIFEMLEHLPNDLWINPNLKWLEPANGIGNFSIVVYYKLMKGLESVIADERIRSSHIIEKMLYMVELNPVNCKVCRDIFKMIDPTTSPNLYEDDFLEWVAPLSFDVIIGNPPFNSRSMIHLKIITKCFSILNNNKHLLLIVPMNVFGGNTKTPQRRGNKVYQELIQHSITLIKTNIQKKHFSTIGEFIIYFHLQSNHTPIKTHFINEKFSVKIVDRPFNPVRLWNKLTEKIFKKVIKSSHNNGFKYERGKDWYEDYKDIRNSEFIYKTLMAYKKGLVIKYSKVKRKGYGEIKVILEAVGHNNSYIDVGNGVGPSFFYMVVPTMEIAKRVEFFFNTKLYKYIQKISISSQYIKNPKYIDIDFIYNKDFDLTEDNIYKEFDLTPTEIQEILNS